MTWGKRAGRNEAPHLVALCERSAPTGVRVAVTSIGLVGVVGSILGMLNLVVPGIVRTGLPSVVYLGLMVYFFCAGLVLLMRRTRLPQWLLNALSLSATGSFLVNSWAMTDPAVYAPPITLVFATMVGALLLPGRLFVLHCGLAFCGVTMSLSRSWTGPTDALLVHIVIQSAILIMTASTVFRLRRVLERMVACNWQLARQDPLTGLANRFRVDEVAASLVPVTHLMVAAVDLDHFKRINDAHGHGTGDRVLVAAAQALREAATAAGLTARIGGEEFVVIASVSDGKGAQRLAKALHAAVGAASADRHLPSVTCSVGFVHAVVPATADPVDWVWRQVSEADAALFRSKAAGRDRVTSGGIDLPGNIVRPDSVATSTLTGLPSRVAHN